MNLETKITIYKFTPQVFTLTRLLSEMMRCKCVCIFADEIKGLLAARNLHPFAICIL